ncbi:hypothetical protein A8C56_16135 [Niabella ginsenosidivorans]|uniref:Streptomycin biosynthesis protein StrF domain-containing protein n=1 Tax=Niabella ginsenosidivorans TaxID=1176587 RepID=A0A1A9I6K1_9BACT|nr:glycosyltransferase [Niabella ginsenosidivorans]ANH82282.1 hypothetical protein A8C56_16135 [Niabella ginsenosidivorans]
MLSIVVSSYKEHLYQELKKNIAATIGKDFIYELIQIKNKNRIGVCEAYNQGLEAAKYPHVLFLHEDLVFNTNSWGSILLNIFEADKKIGLIGIAGGTCKTKAPAPWWEINEANKYIFVRHGGKNKNELIRLGFGRQTREHIVRVLSVDGVFIGLRKSTNLRFNEQLKGYHQYDLGISMDAYIGGYTAVCTDLIDITHYSAGNVDKSWIETADVFFDLYGRYLPITIADDITVKQRKQLEKKNYTVFINRALEAGLKSIAKKYWWHLFWLKPLSGKTFALLKKILKK